MGIRFSDFDHQPSLKSIRRNTPIPGQYNLNLNAFSSSSSNNGSSGTFNNSPDKKPISTSKVPSIPLNKARQQSPTTSGQIPGIKMNIDFKKFDNSGSSIRLPTPRPGQTIGPGGIPDDEMVELANSYQNPEEEESNEENTDEADGEDYENIRIDINQIQPEEGTAIDANNPIDNGEEDLPDVKVDIDFSKFDDQYHTDRFATPRHDNQNDEDGISLGEEEEEEAADTEQNEMENIRIDIPQEFGNDTENNNNADVSMNIDFTQFDRNVKPIIMSTPRPDAPDVGIELEEDEEELNDSKNEVKRPIPNIPSTNNKPKRMPMLPKIPNNPGSLPAKVPKRLPAIPINFPSNNNAPSNNTPDEPNNADVKVDIDFKQFDGGERAIRMPTPRPVDSSPNDPNDISLGEEEEEAFEDDNGDMGNVVIAIPLDPNEDNNNIEEDSNIPNDVTMNIDFGMFDGQVTSNHMATPRPAKEDNNAVSAEEEEEEAEPEPEVNKTNTTPSNNRNCTHKFTFRSPPAPKRTASTPSPSPTKNFKFSIPPSSDADNDYNTDTLTDNDDIHFYIPNESNLSTPRPGQSCVREAFKDAQRAANIDDEEDVNDEPIVINASIPLAPSVDENDLNVDDVRPMRRSTPRPVHKQQVVEEDLQADSSDDDLNDGQVPLSPSKTKSQRPKSSPPFKVKSAANYKLPLIPLNVLRKKKSEANPETEKNVNTDPNTDSSPKNGDAVVVCSSTSPKQKVSSPPKSMQPSQKIPLLNFGSLQDSNGDNKQ